MDRKTRNLLIIIGVVIIAIIAIAGVILYSQNLILTSKKDEFQKAFNLSFSQISEFINYNPEKDYTDELESVDYTEDTKINIDYQKNDTTFEEYTADITGTTINTTDKAYKDITLRYGNSEILNLEYLQENDELGINFLDIPNRFIAVENNQLGDLLNKLGIETININSIDKSEILSLLDFTEEEKQTLIETYINIIVNETTEDSYTYQSNVTLSIDENQTIDAEQYTLTLGDSQIRRIVENVLNQLKNDEIILNKLRANNTITSADTVYVEYIDNLLTEFQAITARLSDLKISVYLVENVVINTTIEYDQIALSFDITNSDNEQNLNLQYQNNAQENAHMANFTLNKKIDDNRREYTLTYSDSENNNLWMTRSIVTMERKTFVDTAITFSNNNINQLEIYIDQNITKENVGDITLDFSRAIVLNGYDEETLNSAITSLRSSITDILNQRQEELNTEFINTIIENLNRIAQEQAQREAEEVENFNQKFSLYQSENVNSEIVDNLLNVVVENISDYEMIEQPSEDEEVTIYSFVINIEENSSNSEAIETIRRNLNTDITYNISFGYDNDNKINRVTIEPYVEPEE